MKQGSKKGACSAHIEAAKANCLKHDRREGHIPSYVNPHLTHTNRVVFEDAMIADRKNITPLVYRAEKLYTEKTGQKCQKRFTPFREDVLKLKPGITDEQLMAFKAKVEAGTGWKVVGIWLHQDEGHNRSKYIEGDEDFDINYHAHVLYSCQDQKTGKAIQPGRKYFNLRQDWLAAATGMERGNPASETGIRHRSSMEQRIHSQEQRIDDLERQAEERERKHQADMERVAKEIKALEQERDRLQNEVDGLNVSLARKEAAIESAKTFSESVKGLLGQSAKDKEILALQDSNKALETKLKEVETGKANDKRVWQARIDEATKAREAAEYRVEQQQKDYQKAMEKERQHFKTTVEYYLDILFRFWPAARNAVKAIVERVISSNARQFTKQQATAIDAAMANAKSVGERKEYGKQLMILAQPTFDELGTNQAWIDQGAEEVQRIAEDRTYINQLREGRGISMM